MARRLVCDGCESRIGTLARCFEVIGQGVFPLELGFGVTTWCHSCMLVAREAVKKRRGTIAPCGHEEDGHDSSG